MPDYKIEKVLVEKEAERYALTHGILQRLQGIPVKPFENIDSVARPGKSYAGKDILPPCIPILTFRGLTG